VGAILEVRLIKWELESCVLKIHVRGEGVSEIETNAPENPSDPDALTPDPILFLQKCCRMGFFSAANAPSLVFDVIENRAKVALQEQHWRIHMSGVKFELLRVFCNVLLGRNFDSIQIESEDSAGNHSDWLNVPESYAGLTTDQFELDYEEPFRAYRDRSVKVHLRDRPSDDQLSRIYEIIELWNGLLLLGAYPPGGCDPKWSGAAPDVASIVEPRLIEQTFPEIFMCNEAAFAPLVFGLSEYQRHEPIIAKVEIR
jgi:hypothetical protein